MLTNTAFSPRTDMADEAHRLWLGSCKDKSLLSGIMARQYKIHSLDVSEIEIIDERGEQALGKSRGKYFSVSLPEVYDRGSEIFSDCVHAVADLFNKTGLNASSKILVAALGNPDITPDALGNLAASSILVTAHLDKERFPQFSSVSVCRPGVLGTSGIESALQVKALADIFCPELVIAIDSLAGSEPERLCRSIQISDAGISPGSGVANDRLELSKAVLGVPVISVGMPMVIDAAFLGDSNFSGMFVTPRSIDSMVRNAARIIAYAINLAAHSGISIEDIDTLLG